MPIGSLTSAMLAAHYLKLERTGLRGAKGEQTGQPLSRRSVRYVHSIVHRALQAAVDSRQLPSNPAAARDIAPSARQAAAPEMTSWSDGELRAFLAWSAEHS